MEIALVVQGRKISKAVTKDCYGFSDNTAKMVVFTETLIHTV